MYNKTVIGWNCWCKRRFWFW